MDYKRKKLINWHKISIIFEKNIQNEKASHKLGENVSK